MKLKNGADVLISNALPEDAAEILSYVEIIGGESEFLTFGSEGIGLTVEEEAEYLNSMLDSHRGIYLKAVISGKIVGTLSAQRSNRPRLAHATEFGLSIFRAYWGLGIGSAMLDRLTVWGRSSGLRKINLRVHELNDRAIRLYERYGFKREGVRTRAFRSGDQFFDELMMGLPLD
jgi:RimJ/RimL family protein N-acetyltransferase